MYEYLVIQPSIRAASNNKDIKAFEEWIHLLAFTAHILDNVKTNFDVRDAMDISRMADDTSQIFTSSLESAGGSARTLSFEVRYAMMWLYESTSAIFFGNKTGTVTLRELEQTVLNKIENLTTEILNITSSVAQANIRDEGVNLAQQL